MTLDSHVATSIAADSAVKIAIVRRTNTVADSKCKDVATNCRTTSENVLEEFGEVTTKKGKTSKDCVNRKKGDLDDSKDNEKTNEESDTDTDEEAARNRDVGFSVEIVSPDAEPFEIHLSSVETISDIRQLLKEREDTCHRTCFTLQLDGKTLKNSADAKHIVGLTVGSQIKVVEEPYTPRESRIHVKHVRDLAKSIEPVDAYNGVGRQSLSFLKAVSNSDVLDQIKLGDRTEECLPPKYVMPAFKGRLLRPLQPVSYKRKHPPCFKVLTVSSWNPPPGYRKLHGDFMYFEVETMEEKYYCLTACTRGFYVNQSSREIFDPRPAIPCLLAHSLVDVLTHLSPAFKREFPVMQWRRMKRHAYEYVAAPYQLYAWCAPQTEHTFDGIRAEDEGCIGLDHEDYTPGQMRDWNRELQEARELPKVKLRDRLIRERTIFKVYIDFVAAATRGAVAVVEGRVEPYHDNSDPKKQVYEWNNIFYTFAFDAFDHYIEIGGDAAAFAASRLDLEGVRAYSDVDLPDLYTVATVVVDYRGYRLTAQSIIQGVLDRPHEKIIVYGSPDCGDTIFAHDKFLELLTIAGKRMKIAPHKVVNIEDEEIELCSGIESKGIIGNDSRHYVLDLIRTFPPDVNYLKLDGVDVSTESRALGFPLEYKHQLVCLRQELVDAFLEARYIQLIKFTSAHLKKLKSAKYTLETDVDTLSEKKPKRFNLSEIEGGIEVEFSNRVKEGESEKNEKNESVDANDNGNTMIPSTADSKENDSNPSKMQPEEVKAIVDSIADDEKPKVDENTNEIVHGPATSVVRMEDLEIDVGFNPNLYAPGVYHADPNSEMFRKQRQLVRDAATYLLTVQLPAFITECSDHSAAPIDGKTFVEALHTRGINVRYLGKVATVLADIPELQYLHRIAVSELVLRSARHIFINYIRHPDLMSQSASVSHFLNCLLSSAQLSKPQSNPEAAQSKSAKKRNKRKDQNSRLQPFNNEWANLTPKTLWQEMKSDLKTCYDWETPSSDALDALIEHFNIQKISLLRGFCLRTGIQIVLREYNFNDKVYPTFVSDDIMNIFPVTKYINPRANEAQQFFISGQRKVQMGDVEDGYELIIEALNLLHNVYGPMHPQIARCLRIFARVNYILGDQEEALTAQQKAVFMSERVNGIDHPCTILEYIHLAFYAFACGQVAVSLQFYYRARYLMLLICGDDHPQVALIDSNISLILHALSEYELSLHFLQHALKLNIRYHGADSLRVAVIHHLVARSQSMLGDFRAALDSEKIVYAIYKQHFGEDHEKTQNSNDCLLHLTQQAVFLQRKVNKICATGNGAIPPIEMEMPIMDSVMDMLHVINGIFVDSINLEWGTDAAT